MDQGFDEYVQRLAKRNEAEQQARLFEPRLFWDQYVFDGSTQLVPGNADAFRNGERFPVRITHLLAAIRSGTEERYIQRYGLRVKAHGTYYQNGEHTPLPLLHNVPVAASDAVTQAQSTYRLERPFVLGNRDALEVEVSLITTPGNGAERVSVAFDGVGRYSRQPKKIIGTLEISDTLKHVIDANELRNDGREPFEIHAVTVHHVPNPSTANPVGDVRDVRLRIRNPGGNGTGQWWMVGPADQTNQRIDAGLLGLTCGRAVVHRLPCEGWLLYPGEGFDTEMLSYETDRTDTVVLGAIGYCIVL